MAEGPFGVVTVTSTVPVPAGLVAVIESSLLTVNDSAYDTYTGVSKSPSTNGSYSSNLSIFDASVSYRF